MQSCKFSELYHLTVMQPLKPLMLYHDSMIISMAICSFLSIYPKISKIAGIAFILVPFIWTVVLIFCSLI